GVVAGTANVTTGALNIGTVVPGAHTTASGTGLNVSLGAGNMATAGSIAHHRILTPQHGGAQTIAYLPSTTPVTATNLKAGVGGSGGVVADSSVAGNNDGNSVTTAGAGGGSGRITQLSANTVVATSGGGPANTVVQPQTVQYSTSYNVSSIPAAVLLKLDLMVVYNHVTMCTPGPDP
ncbi:hypothetical protein DOY81_012672, partial [Sarcophaga bullata]